MPTQSDRFSQTVPHKKLITDYMYEVKALAKALKLKNFSNILNDLENYPATLERAKDIDALALIEKSSKGKFVISSAEMSEYSRKLFYSVHLAACCNLFREKTLPLDAFEANALTSLLLNFISNPQQLNNIEQIYSLLHTMDGMRTIQLLRLAGLITRPSHEMYQLALGVGSALKDIHYLHALPYLKRQQGPQGSVIEFNIQLFPVKHIIVSDADPRYKSHFELFSEDDTPPVLAFNMNTVDTFKALQQQTITKRNFVSLIRVDHNMIPNTREFISQLLPFISDGCDFVISMGLGDTLDEFRGRTKLLKSLFDLFSKASLRPVLFKLHGNGELKKQWSNLHFGSPAASTYQILHCKLKTSLLQDFLNK